MVALLVKSPFQVLTMSVYPNRYREDCFRKLANRRRSHRSQNPPLLFLRTRWACSRRSRRFWTCYSFERRSWSGKPNAKQNAKQASSNPRADTAQAQVRAIPRQRSKGHWCLEGFAQRSEAPRNRQHRTAESKNRTDVSQEPDEYETSSCSAEAKKTRSARHLAIFM